MKDLILQRQTKFEAVRGDITKNHGVQAIVNPGHISFPVSISFIHPDCIGTEASQKNTLSRREYLPYTKGNPRGKCEDSFALWLNIGYNIATRKELILCRLFQCVI